MWDELKRGEAWASWAVSSITCLIAAATSRNVRIMIFPIIGILLWVVHIYFLNRNSSKPISKIHNVKQVIVIRKDLRNKEGQKVRSGKIIAQACHASIAFLTNKLRKNESLNEIEKAWVEMSFTKVCLGVDSEHELLEIHRKCLEMGVVSNLILDAGRTEFGEPTHTCLGIGPEISEKIDGITGQLKLF